MVLYPSKPICRLITVALCCNGCFVSAFPDVLQADRLTVTVGDARDRKEHVCINRQAPLT